MSKQKYALRCIAPDGAYVTESADFDSVDAANLRSNDMGSRWFFYPIHVVTGKKRIIAVPDGMSELWIGKHLDTLRAEIKLHPEWVCAWVNGEASCPL